MVQEILELHLWYKKELSYILIQNAAIRFSANLYAIKKINI